MAKIKRTVSYNDADYDLETVYDKKAYSAITSAEMTSLFRVVYPILSIVFLILGIGFLVYALMTEVTRAAIGRALVLLICGIAVLAMCIVIPHDSLKKDMSRLLQNYGSSSVTMRLLFFEDEMVLADPLTADKASYSYDSVRKVIRKKGYFLFGMDGGQWIILQNDSIPNGFADYISGKCPNA